MRAQLGFLGQFQSKCDTEHRIHGQTALLGSSYTFDPRKGSLNTNVPCIDVSRHVSDGLMDRWVRMCNTMRSRPGIHKVGDNVLTGKAYTASGIQGTDIALRPHPHLQNVRALFECRRACLYGFTCLRTCA